MTSIYSPDVRREARLFGITELQAWRKINARKLLQQRMRDQRRLPLANRRAD